MADAWEDWFEDGELLLWEGAPVPGIRHPFRNMFLTAFGTPFFIGGVAVFGTGVGLLFSGPSIFSFLGMLGLIAFSTPFLAVGVGLMLGPWLHDAMKHTRVRYALSNRAGYVATRWWKREMKVYPIAPGARIEFDEDQDGVGSIWFHFERSLDSDGDAKTEKKGFEAVADAKHLFDMLRDLTARSDRGSDDG